MSVLTILVQVPNNGSLDEYRDVDNNVDDTMAK